MNPIRLDFIRSQRSAVINTTTLSPLQQMAGQHVLDVGCGGGLLSEGLSRLGANVVGIDPSEANIMVGKGHSQQDPATRNISYRQATVEELVVAGEQFDVVCALEVLEHVERPHTFLAQCVSCVRPGGSLFVSTMNRTIKSYLLAIVTAEHVMGIVPTGTHDWNKFWDPKDIQTLLRTSGLKIIATKGIVPTLSPWRPGLLTAWTLSDDTDVNYIIHAVKS